MSLKLQHFDTKLKQDLDVREKIDNSLGEYLFPGTEFAIGMVYKEAATPADLGQYQGLTLQFASGERLYFASQAVRDLLYPTPSDGAAYGSLVFTPNKSFVEKKELRVLVVDDSTGANGEIMPPDVAKKLVGDCYGKVSHGLAAELIGASNTPFQFRIGIKPQAESEVYRIAKGTLAPSDLSNLYEPYFRSGRNQAGELQTKSGYDLILATSSFKGRKGADAIQPGEYSLTLGIGVKALAEYGEHSLGTQILINYPRGIQADILCQLNGEAERLSEIQAEPRRLAKLYIEKYERRQQLLSDASSQTSIDQSFQNTEFSVDTDLATIDSVMDDAFGNYEDDISSEQNKQDLLLYRLLKADLSGHTQVLEHPKVIDGLNKFVNKQWKDIATGRAIKFNSGLAQPSLNLGKNEICVPILPEGEEVIVTRSPLVNSNGVIVLTNKHLPEAWNQKGTIHIHPETALEHLQADFDGDRLAFELASKYPTLTTEIKEYNLDQNRYPNVVKRQKVAYTGTFEEIAITAMENKIGLLANQIQKAVALQWETQLIPPEKKSEYLNQILKHYKKLIKSDSNPSKELQLPPHLKERIEKLANLTQPISFEKVDFHLGEVKKILFDTVSELSNELQVAVDGPKSAVRPDETVLSYCKAISEYIPMGWLADKKKSEVFVTRPMESTNYSPIDLMVQQTNKLYSQSSQTARPTIEFKLLFQTIKFTEEHQAEAREITANYNFLIRQAIDLDKRAEKDSGPTLIATSTASGKQIQITNLLKFEPIDSPVWTEQALDIKLYPNEQKSLPNTLKAVVVTDREGNSCHRPIGTVSEESVREHNLKVGIRLQASVTLTPGATATQVKAKFKEATDYLQEVRQNIPEPEQLAVAAAVWHLNHARSETPNSLRKASVAFNAFPDLVVNQLSNLQFTDLQVVGVHQPTNELLGKKWNGEKVQAAIALETNPDSPNQGKRIVTVEGKKFAPLSSESPALPVGTQFEAEIVLPPGASVIATTPKGNSLKITQIRTHEFAGRQWDGESAQIQVGFLPNPNPSKPPVPVALVERKVLGVLDFQSVEKLKEANLLKLGATFSVSLQTAPGTTASLKVKPKSVVYPHQQQESYNESPIEQPHIKNRLAMGLTDHSTHSPSRVDQVFPSSQPTPATVLKKGDSQIWKIPDKSLKPAGWPAVALAIGRSPEYVARVRQVTQPGLPLSDRANTAMQQDFNLWQESNATLQQWFAAAAAIGKPPSYLDRIAKVAIAFNSEQQPTPLSQEVFTAIQRDLSAHETLKQMSAVQNLSNSEPNAVSRNVQTSHYLDPILMEQSERAICQATEIMLEMVGVQSDNGDITFTSENYNFKQQFTEKGSLISIQARIDAHLVMSNGKLMSSVLPEDMEAMQLLQNTAAEILAEKQKIKKNISLRL